MMRVDIQLDRSDIQLAISEYLAKRHNIHLEFPGDIQFRTVQNAKNEFITDIEARYVPSKA